MKHINQRLINWFPFVVFVGEESPPPPLTFQQVITIDADDVITIDGDNVIAQTP